MPTSAAKVAIIAGYGIGISAGVARRFGAEGYKLALLARTESRLAAAAEELSKAGIPAKGYSTDLSDPAAVRAAVAAVQNDLGPVNVLFWNPYGKLVGLLDSRPEEFVSEFNLEVTGLLTAVQAAYADLKATQGSVLVTGNGFSLEDNEHLLQLALIMPAVNLAVVKAAQRKLVHLLNKELAKDGIYAVEVTVMGVVRGTPADVQGKSHLTPEGIADTFWHLQQKRDPAVWYARMD